VRQRHLPAETAPQSGVLLTWPHLQTDWKDTLAAVEVVYLDIARAIAARETLQIICCDEQHQAHVERLLQQAGMDSSPVRYSLAPTNDTWIRDYGPISVIDDGEPCLLDFVFNGWGGKYPAGLDDNTNHILAVNGVFGNTPLQRISLVLEGGSIDTDGEGNLLTTSRCLLSPDRNPGRDKASLEAELKSLLGIGQILWLDHGALEGDDTDSHIDTLARFCGAGAIAYTHCDDPDDVHYSELHAMEAQLRRFRDRNGRAYLLEPLPLPAPVVNAAGQRLPANYANFLIINGAVLVPAYNDPADEVAAQALGRRFPDREMIPVNCLPLIAQFGSLHCITMQLVEGVLR